MTAPSQVPRWEWRAFATGFGDIEQQLRSRAPSSRFSSEIYIVSDRSDANTKIRDGLVDVKILQRADAHGLELWQPTFKSGFPLAAESIALLFRAWGVWAPATLRDAASLEAFLQDIVAPHGSLREVHVAKRRMGCIVDECLVEIADLTFAGEPIRTIAVEHADPARAWGVVETLGLADRRNVNYVKALKQFLSTRTDLKHGMRLEAQS